MIEKKKNVRLSRKKAEELIAELLNRVEEVNKFPKEKYWERVVKVAVFGSYLTDKEKLGDLDIAIKTEKLWKSDEEYKLYIKQCHKEAPYWASWIDRMFWKYHELRKFLQKKSTGISLADWSVLEQGFNHKIIYEYKK